SYHWQCSSTHCCFSLLMVLWQRDYVLFTKKRLQSFLKITGVSALQIQSHALAFFADFARFR
ncbi:MAG: hypothetical protein ACTS8H_01435, partial [Arsenophonus sp. NC-PE1-MAG3]